MATLGEVTTAVWNHEERLRGHDARHANFEQRMAAMESELITKLAGLMAQAGNGEKKDGLRIQDGKDNLP